MEISRSYSQKVKIGEYLTSDFFASAKAEVSADKIKEKSEELFELCYQEVMKSIEKFKKENTIEPKKPKPIPKRANPKKYLTEAGGLYLLSHHFVNKGANIIMYREFKMANHVTGTSVSVD